MIHFVIWPQTAQAAPRRRAGLPFYIPPEWREEDVERMWQRGDYFYVDWHALMSAHVIVRLRSTSNNRFETGYLIDCIKKATAINPGYCFLDRFRAHTPPAHFWECVTKGLITDPAKLQRALKIRVPPLLARVASEYAEWGIPVSPKLHGDTEVMPAFPYDSRLRYSISDLREAELHALMQIALPRPEQQGEGEDAGPSTSPVEQVQSDGEGPNTSSVEQLQANVGNQGQEGDDSLISQEMDVGSPSLHPLINQFFANPEAPLPATDHIDRGDFLDPLDDLFF